MSAVSSLIRGHLLSTSAFLEISTIDGIRSPPPHIEAFALLRNTAPPPRPSISKFPA